MDDKHPTAPGLARGQPARRARGFTRAGGLIETQMRTAAAKRGFVQARLRALWPEIAGPDFATITTPVKLTHARGPAGGLLTLAVSGAHALQVQMLIPILRDRVNAALGPGTVGRIQLTHANGDPAERARPAAPEPDPGPPPDLGPVADSLSTIGDDELRSALETLARNVVRRTRIQK